MSNQKQFNYRRTLNKGDKINESNSLEEKQAQLAVDAGDITGEHLQVPTYITVEQADGEQKVLHHIRDAEEISDVIRQARVNESGERIWD